MNSIISVIVPIYNVEDYLPRCIESIRNQTYKNLEIILVNDGSTDKSGQIANNYKRLDQRIKVVHKANGGLSDARNVGIKEATGKYITFVDSDDFLEKDIYQASIDIIENEDIDILVYELLLDYENGKKKELKITKEELLNKEEAIIKLNSFCNIDFSACNKIYKKELFENIEFPLNKKCEDIYTMYKLFEKSQKIYLLPKIGYHYWYREGSITHSKSVNLDYIKAFKEQMKYFDKYGNIISDTTKSSYAYACINIINSSIIKKIENKDIRKQLFKESKQYSKYVYKNRYLNFKKKIQFFVYEHFFYIYIIIIKLKSKL